MNPRWLAKMPLIVVLLAGCAETPPVLQRVHEAGLLRVATLNHPTSYYLGAHNEEGLEFNLARAFAEQQGLQLAIKPVPNLGSARAMLANGEADMVAAQVTADAEWRRAGLATQTYMEVSQLIVQRRGPNRPANVAALRGKHVVVHSDSPQTELLREMQSNGAGYLRWTELQRDQADPLDWVSSGDADYAVVDSTEFAFERHVYPEIMVAFALSDPRSLQWVVRRDGLDLRDAANAFLASAQRVGLIERLNTTSQAAAREFEYLEALRFQDDMEQRLPALRSWFETAAETTGLDWRLLAAVGYQESKWQERAVSPDGASGIMMLMAKTAQSVGVKNRFDPEQSIAGGARYLARVLEMIPTRIAEPERTWFALAAYNVGYGHLEDARILAQAHGRNPDSWAVVREYLPLLAQETYYQRAKRGYARGWEPVRFVDQVRGFLAVLEWFASPVEEIELREIVPVL